MDIVLKPRRTAAILTAVTITLVMAQVAALVLADLFPNKITSLLFKLFDLDGEKNIPTFFSVVLLLLASLLLYIIAHARKASATDGVLWLLLSAIFLYLALDELVALHEHLTKTTRNVLGTSGLFYFAWVIPYGLGLLTLLVVYWNFLHKIPSPHRNLIVLAAAVYLLGAVGMELPAGREYEMHAGRITGRFIAFSTIEETLEMFGLIIFIYALMTYIGSELKTLTIRTSSNSLDPPGPVNSL